MPQSVAIIIPCHNESENVPLIYRELVKTFRDDLTALQAQIWFVNDGSSDDTLQQIKQLQAKDDQVHFIDLSRSFGKEAAMYAGLSTAKADYYAVMDADLQDPPAMLPDMYAALQDGYDMAGAQRTDRSGEARKVVEKAPRSGLSSLRDPTARFGSGTSRGQRRRQSSAA